MTETLSRVIRCKAVKRDGTRCRRYAVPGREVCPTHGGSSPLPGALHPRFKTGRYSKALPVRLLERYQESLTDPDLLALHDEIALIDTRLYELLQRVDTGESASLWTRLQNVYSDLVLARRHGDPEGVAQALNAIGQVIQQGGSEAELWTEMRETIQDRRKLAESEHKRLVSIRQVMTAEEALTLLAVITDIIRRHVPDRVALTSISRELAALVHRPGSVSEIELGR